MTLKMTFSQNKYLSCYKKRSQSTHRMVCFPSAGGDATMFKDWHHHLQEMEVWGVTYPGRGVLSGIECVDSLGDLVSEIANDVCDLKGQPLLFLGHSFGALVAYLVAFKLNKCGVEVDALFACARRAPHLKDRHGYTAMTRQQALISLREVGGLPKEIERSQEFLDFYLNIILNDLSLNETVVPEVNGRLSIPFHVYGADKDKLVNMDELNAWQRLTDSECVVNMVHGDHFFIANQKEKFLSAISKAIENIPSESVFIAY